MSDRRQPRIAHRTRTAVLMVSVLSAAMAALGSAAGAEPSIERHREYFVDAWDAARRGDRQTFNGLRPHLEGYVLHPYLEYEHYRFNRAQVAPADMASFLEAHADWAFAAGLETAWLKSLGERRQWEPLLRYGAGHANTEVRCYHARARLAAGHTEGLLADAQALWAAPQSQPKACDPLFDWLVDNGGITRDLAWQRIRLAMEAGNPRFTLYLARFLPPGDRPWLERWQRLNAGYYRDVGDARGWPDNDLAHMIVSVSLERLARRDAGQAMRAFRRLDGHVGWDADTRARVLRQVALMGAVDLDPDAMDFIADVPPAYRDDQLMEWKARLALSLQDWQGVLDAIGEMSPATAGDSRWRYWEARAQLALGRAAEGDAAMRELAAQSNYHGFLAADRSGLPYTLCPLEPDVNGPQAEELRSRGDIRRALELRRVQLDDWALREWSLAMRRLPVEELKVAAAVAREEGWHDRAIFALGDSGELRYYEWRFPLLWEEPVMVEAGRADVDPAWVYGIMRSESAMTETARSPAGALGLMQVTPGTASQIARRQGIPYGHSSDLLEAQPNIRFGTSYLREMLDRFDGNAVLAAAAYNAGPQAVERWLQARPVSEPAVWIETLPYFETRDYIPRVLAFTTIYDWRLRNPVRRVSWRMPDIPSGQPAALETTQVVCRPPDTAVGVAGP